MNKQIKKMIVMLLLFIHLLVFMGFFDVDSCREKEIQVQIQRKQITLKIIPWPPDFRMT